MHPRPANTPTAIHPSLQIGIPAFIADREDIFKLYFVTVTPVAQVTTAPGKMQVGKYVLNVIAVLLCLVFFCFLPAQYLYPLPAQCFQESRCRKKYRYLLLFLHHHMLQLQSMLLGVSNAFWPALETKHSKKS